MAGKEHWRLKRRIIDVDPEEDSITEDSKRTLSLRTLKRILAMKNE